MNLVWGAENPKERGPVVASRHAGSIKKRYAPVKTRLSLPLIDIKGGVHV